MLKRYVWTYGMLNGVCQNMINSKFELLELDETGNDIKI